MYPQQPGWGPAQPTPPKPNRAPLFVALGVAVFSCVSCMIVGALSRLGEEQADEQDEARAQQAQALAAQQAAQLTAAQQAAQQAAQAAQAAAGGAPGVCQMYSPSNPNSSPANRQLIASTIEDRLRARLSNAARVVVGPTGDTLELSGVPTCNSALITGMSAVAGSYEASARILCTTNGFRQVNCRSLLGQEVKLDLDHQCQCTDRFNCVCPRPGA